MEVILVDNALESTDLEDVRGDCYNKLCPARSILSHLSSRWGMLIMALLRSTETLRFSELRNRIDGVSEKVLSQKLRELERDGLIARKMYPVVPPRVEYRLTPLGAGVAGHVDALVAWIETNIDELELARTRYDA